MARKKLPLNVRYSSQRLESAAGVRRLCLAALHHLLKHDMEPSWLKLRGVLSHMPRMQELANASKSWGHGVECLPVPRSPSRSPTPRVADSEDVSSDSNSSASVHVPCPGQESLPDSVEAVLFVRPSRGLWRVTIEEQSLEPLLLLQIVQAFRCTVGYRLDSCAPARACFLRTVSFYAASGSAY